MNHTGILKSMWAGSMLLGTIGLEAAQPANLIIINCDDMGYGDLSCFGNPSIRTPHLDRMAFEGQKWTDFYVSSSVSSPSRAGLMTGRLGVRTGMYGNQRNVLFPDSPEGLPETEVTLPELLKKAGYHTACIGKWHLGHTPAYLPLNHGFDYFYGFPFSNDMSKGEQYKLGNRNYPYEYVLYEQKKVIEKEPSQDSLTYKVTQAAVRYIAEHRDNPFFLYLAHPMPHFPVYASAGFQQTSYGGRYGDTIEEIDWSVGRVLDTLKAYGLDRNTLVVFTSDNGPWLFYKQEGGSAGPLRAGKGTHYEGGFRVPCIVWGAGVASGHVTQMGSTLDLLPTFCELAGVELPSDREYDGVSLLPVWKDSSAASPRKLFFYYKGSQLMAVRKERYKLHLKEGEPVLYDLGNDPGEKFNVASQYPEVVVELTELARKQMSNVKIKESIFDKLPVEHLPQCPAE